VDLSEQPGSASTVKKDWKASLREQLLTSETTFRHDLSFVPVSSIAGQYYCEVKVDHEYVRGRFLPRRRRSARSCTRRFSR